MPCLDCVRTNFGYRQTADGWPAPWVATLLVQEIEFFRSVISIGHLCYRLPLLMLNSQFRATPHATKPILLLNSKSTISALTPSDLRLWSRRLGHLWLASGFV